LNRLGRRVGDFGSRGCQFCWLRRGGEGVGVVGMAKLGDEIGVGQLKGSVLGLKSNDCGVRCDIVAFVWKARFQCGRCAGQDGVARHTITTSSFGVVRLAVSSCCFFDVGFEAILA
jgi:hypothetical protein